jgi:hypothetical protein
MLTRASAAVDVTLEAFPSPRPPSRRAAQAVPAKLAVRRWVEIAFRPNPAADTLRRGRPYFASNHGNIRADGGVPFGGNLFSSYHLCFTTAGTGGIS